MGKINGKDIYHFSKQLDYTLNQQDRINLLNNILYNERGLDEYFEEVFEQKDVENGTDTSHIKLCIDKNGFLSQDINVCQVLEKMSDYILYSPDGERITKKTIYNFYPKDIFEKKLKKEEQLGDTTDCESNDEHSEVIDFLIGYGKNFKKEIKQEITNKDLIDKDLVIVKEYENFIKLIKKYKENDDLTFTEKKKLNSLLKTLSDDEIICKDKLKGVIYFKQAMKDSTVIDYDKFDFTNISHILALMKMPIRSNLSEDLACLILDLENIIKQIELSSLEKNILKLWRLEDETQESIAECLNITQSYVSKVLNKIAKKIIRQYKINYVEWHYTYVEKGVYKKCSCCGEIKLIHNFDVDKKNSDGYKNKCKECNKSRQK
jgi:predicted XRE-type DNA-binding protein